MLTRLRGCALARSSSKKALYADGAPVSGFNSIVLQWLRKEIAVREHSAPKAFDFMRAACDVELVNILASGLADNRWDAYRVLLSDLTKLMFGDDISGRLSSTLSGDNINPAGFRSQLSQSVAKNTGENFLYAIAYCLADALSHQDEILVDKGRPPLLKQYLTMHRAVPLANSETDRVVTIDIECDLAVWCRSDPAKAIVVNAKTRLKEVFHIGTMWKLLYDMLGDEYCQQKWGLTPPAKAPEMRYVFATADMVRPTGTKSQGPDVERDAVRNLIAMDASFFDYTFVSKSGIGHVSSTLDLGADKESLFHELGCLMDLVEQVFPEHQLR